MGNEKFYFDEYLAKKRKNPEYNIKFEKARDELRHNIKSARRQAKRLKRTKKN